MSQYLNIFLKKEDTRISLVELGTTPARQIADLGAFPYTPFEILLKRDLIKSYLSMIIEEKNKYSNYLDEEIHKQIEIKQNLYKCISKEVAQMFLENLNDIEQRISEFKESINEWDCIINQISFVLDVLENNEDEWQLYYSNC